MANRVQNLKRLFGNPRARVMLVATFALLILGVSSAWVSLRSRLQGSDASAKLVGLKNNITSIPGSQESTVQYAKLQIKQNIDSAKTALKTGRSAIPTILDSSYVPPDEDFSDGHDANKKGAHAGHGHGDQHAHGHDGNQGADSNAQGADGKDGTGQGTSGQSDKGASSTSSNSNGQNANGQNGSGQNGQGQNGSGANGQNGQGQNESGANGQNGQGQNGSDANGQNGQGQNGAGANGQGPSDSSMKGQDALSGLHQQEQQALNQFLKHPEESLQDRIRARQQQQMSEQAFKQAVQHQKAAMSAQASQLFSAWMPPPTQQYEVGEPAADTTSSGLGANGMGSTHGKSNGPVLVKAGKVLFGVLTTAVNSDEPGPVMAQIVQGPYKGARLIGKLTLPSQTASRVVLNFDTMTLPNRSESFSISAVAIDPETARTALSTSTNHHYLLRYGSLFASAFLEGYAQALTQSGATSTTQPSGAITYAFPALKPKEKVAVGFGKVGSRYASILSSNFSKPPTVKVQSGTGLGILFLHDLKP